MGKGKGKKNGNKERALVSRERRIALALRAVLDAAIERDTNAEDVALAEAAEVLKDLGYGSLVGIPRRLKELREELKAATDADDGAAIARIGTEMVKAQSGKLPKTAAVSATKPSSRKSGATKSTVNTAADSDNVSDASAEGASDG